MRWTTPTAIACLFPIIGGCTTTPKPIAAPPVAVACIPVAEYTPEQEKALAAALEALPATNPLVGAMIDYGRLRAAARACALTK